MTELLFVYGSLTDPQVRKALLGKEVETSADSVRGFRLGTIRCRSGTYPVAIADPECKTVIEGLAISVTEEDLAVLDRYEGSYYRRVRVKLVSGREAWMYVKEEGGYIAAGG